MVAMRESTRSPLSCTADSYLCCKSKHVKSGLKTACLPSKHVATLPGKPINSKLALRLEQSCFLLRFFDGNEVCAL